MEKPQPVVVRPQSETIEPSFRKTSTRKMALQQAKLELFSAREWGLTPRAFTSALKSLEWMLVALSVEDESYGK